MSEHDAKIIAAAEKWAIYFDAAPSGYLTAEGGELVKAVRAKREAETPKLLTAEEAEAVFYATEPGSRHATFQAVLSACLERAAWWRIGRWLPGITSPSTAPTTVPVSSSARPSPARTSRGPR